MAAFPLQPELIDQVIKFANAKLRDPNQVEQIFAGAWLPTEIPTLRTCRRIQADVRDWLAAGKITAGTAQALVGYQIAEDGASDKSKRSPIELTGYLGFQAWKEESGSGGYDIHAEVTPQWTVARATLRALCGLAVCTIFQAGLQDKVRQCKRPGFRSEPACTTFFIDRDSRGRPREYCQSDKCDAIKNRRAVAKSKGKPL